MLIYQLNQISLIDDYMPFKSHFYDLCNMGLYAGNVTPQAFILHAHKNISQLGVLVRHSPAWFQYALLFQPGVCDQYKVHGVF